MAQFKAFWDVAQAIIQIQYHGRHLTKWGLNSEKRNYCRQEVPGGLH